jgi:hypothetical protein
MVQLPKTKYHNSAAKGLKKPATAESYALISRFYGNPITAWLNMNL